MSVAVLLELVDLLAYGGGTGDFRRVRAGAAKDPVGVKPKLSENIIEPPSVVVPAVLGIEPILDPLQFLDQFPWSEPRHVLPTFGVSSGVVPRLRSFSVFYSSVSVFHKMSFR